MTRLVVVLLLVFLLAMLGTLLLAVCVPENASAQRREAWQLGVCLDTLDGTVCRLHGAPIDSNDNCATETRDLQRKIVIGRVRCTKVLGDG